MVNRFTGTVGVPPAVSAAGANRIFFGLGERLRAYGALRAGRPRFQ